MNKKILMIILIIICIVSIVLLNKKPKEIEVVVPELASSCYYEEIVLETPKEEIQIEEEQMPEYKLRIDADLQKHIWNLCKEHEVQYEIVLSIIKLESDFRANLINRNSDGSKDYGLVQMNNRYLDYHKKLLNMEEFDPFDSYQSSMACVKLLKYYYNYWSGKGISQEDLFYLIVGSYNRGVAGMEKFIKQTGKIETAYSKRVLSYKLHLEEHKTFEN
jgi:hypothetical protein